ncbi:MAG: hypothetical protein WBM43_01345 [Flavobacteriaceae bacterium]
MKASGVEPIHIAAQYLAAAAISLLDSKKDDSHSNLGFSVEQQYMTTRALNDDGDHFALSLQDFSLRWISSSSTLDFSLNKHKHHEVLSWIYSVLKPLELSDQYRYEFHYSLPYELPENFLLEASAESLEKDISMRSLAQRVLSEVLQQHSMISEIRIWPHHFDTGAYAQLPNNSEISIGMGLAIPDSMVDDYYFYLSGYKGNKPIDTISFESLANGEWARGDFQGAVLAAGDISKEEALLFFQEGITSYAQ